MLRLWLVVQRLMAALLLPTAASLVFLFALPIRRASRGRVIVRQHREGLGGAVFPMFKLRTMYLDAEDRLAALGNAGLDEEWRRFGRFADDPRVAGPFARWARRYSIDELPQLINVVRGEMALVGPRPLPPDIAARLRPADLIARRRVVPGLTGLWQVSGRSDLDLEEMGRLDHEYVNRRCLRLDLAILLKTLSAVLSARGAY